MQELFIPVGFKFRPSDEQLIEYYLYNKILGIPIPYVDHIVKECDLYGKQEPRHIWESNGGNLLQEDDDLYFFTKLKKKTPKGSRIDRKVGSGVWQGEDAPTEIASSKSEDIIGSKKRFRYEKEGSEENGAWIMHEYTVRPSLLGKNQSTNYVLCRIRKNQPTRTGRNKKSDLAKKRKLLDFKNNTDSVMYKQSFQTIEAGGMDCSGGAGAGQYEVPMAVVVPDEGILTLPMVQDAEPEKMMTQQQNQQPKISSDDDYNFEGRGTGGIDSGEFAEQLQDMLLEQNGICGLESCLLCKPFDKDPTGESVDWENMPCMEGMVKISSDDIYNFGGRETGGIDSSEFAEPLQDMLLEQTGICGLENCLLCKSFDKDPTGESVDWENMPCMEGMLSDQPELLYEEYVFVPTDDEESAGNTSCSVNLIMKEQNLYDHGGEGVRQGSERVTYLPMGLPDQTLV